MSNPTSDSAGSSLGLSFGERSFRASPSLRSRPPSGNEMKPDSPLKLIRTLTHRNSRLDVVLRSYRSNRKARLVPCTNIFRKSVAQRRWRESIDMNQTTLPFPILIAVIISSGSYLQDTRLRRARSDSTSYLPSAMNSGDNDDGQQRRQLCHSVGYKLEVSAPFHAALSPLVGQW
jgi:hypothetical protein